MLWWHWMVLGLILVGLEMAAPGGFYIIFFGIAAIAVGALEFFGLAAPAWAQWLLFSIVAIASLALFRNPLLRRMRLSDTPAVDVDSLVGELAVPLEDIAAGGVGRVELRGTVWSARNNGTAAVAKGRRCTVRQVDRLTLLIEPEGVHA